MGRNTFGFTLIEVLLAVGLLGVLLALGIASFGQSNTKLKLDSTSRQIVSILAEARSKAMEADVEDQPTPSVYGVHFDSDKFTLFRGNSYDSLNPDNFIVATENVTISPNLPCGVPTECSNVIFTQVSGEVVGFDPALNWICLTSGSSATKLTLNFLGVVDEQENC